MEVFSFQGIAPTPREGQSYGMKKRPRNGSGYTTIVSNITTLAKYINNFRVSPLSLSFK